MAAKKKAAGDRLFMDNLAQAVREEYVKVAVEEARARRPLAALAAPEAPKTTGAAAKAAGTKAAPAASARKPAASEKPKAAEAKPAIAKSAAKPVAKAAGKTASAKTTGKAAAAKASKAEKAEAEEKALLLKDLHALLPRLDAEGLAFLLEQAEVHLYNMEAEALEASRAERQRRAAERRGVAPGAAGGLALVRSESGSSYYVEAGDASVMFTKEEMLSLVRLAHGHPDDLEAARALGAWLERERRDALDELRLPGAQGPALKELARLLRSSFKRPGA